MLLAEKLIFAVFAEKIVFTVLAGKFVRFWRKLVFDFGGNNLFAILAEKTQF